MLSSRPCGTALSESCDVLLFERGETLNTGSAAGELGDTVHEQGTKTLTKSVLERLP